MGKANVSRQSLVEAIATLEAQRGLTGGSRNLEQAVETALAALRDKLAQLQAEPGDVKRHQLAVLVADLSGFTALSERMDVERVRDAMNAMWRVLDEVIRAWGGQIDQHAGDSLLALFGLPQPRQGDAARALHAALAMQQELELFNERVRRAADRTFDASSWAGEWPGPEMRIGVHSGPVYFARSSVGARSTAVGETVAEARRLEMLAPAGSVLTSTAVQRQSQTRFTLNPVGEAAAPHLNGQEAYLVVGERAEPAAYVPGRVAGRVARLVGRTEQMDRLELALQATADSRAPQMVTLVGPPGIGKSRLIHEFESRVNLLTGSSVVLRAGTRGANPDAPFALARDLLLRRFDIRPQHSPYLIEQKLRRGLAELGLAVEDEGPVNGIAPAQTLHLLERLLHSGKAAHTSVEEVGDVVGSLLRAVTAEKPAIVVLEGINRADHESLALIDRLAQADDVGPVLFLSVATSPGSGPSIQTIPWLEREEELFSPFTRIDLPPLSSVDSRLMATDILGLLSPPPMRLLDLVVAEAGGRPLYIENIIRLLIGRGVITVGERWRVDMARAEAFSLPTGLPKLMDVRLTQLSEVEQTVLRRAAIMGPLGWDAALIGMKTGTDFSETEIEAALLGLEIKGYLVRDDVYSFAANQAYTFRRDSVREAAYASIPPTECREMHLEVAHWLIAHRNNAQFSAWFPVDSLIAYHFESAGDLTQAAAWRQRAGHLAVVS